MIVVKIGLFVNYVSAKPGHTPVGLPLQPILLLLLLLVLVLVLLLQQVQPLLLPHVLYQSTTTVAEGSFRIMKGLLTADCRGMAHDTQIGYLLAMVNGDVNHRVPQWAFM